MGGNPYGYKIIFWYFVPWQPNLYFFCRFQAVLNKRFSNSGRRLDRFSTGQSDDMELQAAELWAERGFMPQKPPTIHPAQKKIADLRYSYRAAAYTAQEYSKGTYYVA